MKNTASRKAARQTVIACTLLLVVIGYLSFAPRYAIPKVAVALQEWLPPIIAAILLLYIVYKERRPKNTASRKAARRTAIVCTVLLLVIGYLSFAPRYAIPKVAVALHEWLPPIIAAILLLYIIYKQGRIKNTASRKAARRAAIGCTLLLVVIGYLSFVLRFRILKVAVALQEWPLPIIAAIVLLYGAYKRRKVRERRRSPLLRRRQVYIRKVRYLLSIIILVIGFIGYRSSGWISGPLRHRMPIIIQLLSLSIITVGLVRKVRGSAKMLLFSTDLDITSSTVVDAYSLATKLADTHDVLSGFIREQLSPKTRDLLANFTSGSVVSGALELALISDLNHVIKSGALCSQEITSHLLLPDYLTRRFSQELNDNDRSMITRVILDLVFSHELIEQSTNRYRLEKAGGKVGFESPGSASTKGDVGAEPLRSSGELEGRQLELHIVLEQNYLDWEKRYSISISRSAVVPAGGSFTDVEEVTNTEDRPEGFTVPIEADLPFSEAQRRIIDTVWPRTKVFAKDPTQPVPHDRLWLRSPSLSGIDETHTLRELGFQSGDRLVLEWVKQPLAIAVGRLHPRELPRDLKSFFEAVVTDLHSARSLADWDGEYNPSPVGGLALYTEEDVELARYVRQHYAALHFMSGFDLTLYFLEYIPPIGIKERQTARSFWMKHLPSNWVESWNALGLLRSKPFPSGTVYRIARDINVQPEELPCVVLFDHWTKMKYERTLVRITKPPHASFRKVCTDVHNAIEKQGLRDVSSFSFSQFLTDFSGSGVTLRDSHEPQLVPISPGTPARGNVFLCHSSVDKVFVEKLALDLRKLGLGVWLDKWEIRVGDSLVDRIEHGLKTNDYLLIVLSPDAVVSPWVRLELNAALMRELEELKVRILPILYRQTEIPLLIRSKLYADFTKSYDDGMRTLLERLAPEAVQSLPIVRSAPTEPPKE